ncbi:MAG: hypothetical protein ACK553_14540 [Planctomycetota bacterium]|jgi:neutral ceramidase
MNRFSNCNFMLVMLLLQGAGIGLAEEYPWRVGAAEREMVADDAMVIGGGIGPGYAQGQEGKLQATALVVQGETKLCIVAVDILMMHRDYLDQAAREIEARCGIPFDHILINASHTHHAPSTVTVHGYERDQEFCKRTVRGIVEAAVAADREALSSPPTRARFRLGQEATVGQNSRQLLRDGTIYWIGPRDEFVRPTGPFDVDLPVMAFETMEGTLRGAWFNHSTHCIGTRSGKRSPSFYGLAAQELAEQHSAPVLFLSGAAGSTHNLSLSCDEMVTRIKEATNEAFAKGKPMVDSRLRAIKREVPFAIRTFDETKEDIAVVEYCRKYASPQADGIIEVFRDSRRKLKPFQGEERRMWLQAMRIGDVYLVAVPAEFFTALGLEIKRRSPYRYTFVCGLSNDYVGYTPTREGFVLGGYQTWTGLHSFSEIGTGEMIVEESLKMLRELEP